MSLPIPAPEPPPMICFFCDVECLRIALSESKETGIYLCPQCDLTYEVIEGLTEELEA